MLRHLVSQLRARLEKEDASSSASSASASPAQHSPYPRHPSLIKTTSVNADSANEEAFLEGFRAVSLNNTRHSRFLGRSSHFPLMKAALNMKREIIEESRHGKHDVAAHATKRRPQFWLQNFCRGSLHT
ncbi:hypothetical protein PsYK624_058980 [Phanerochaete sordida]|uniref:Uncharacterized protein n=1 Tax=Phanerochaete sordida TaxID=48140 RepID=A0A9P3G996_9APHY|nr:hypothetical protein PsYK624_058980 [Phanerochaete sordida]